MSEIIKKMLDVAELEKQLAENEKLQFLFISNGTPHPNGNEHMYCKNGHWNFVSNYMGFEPGSFVQIKCSECDEIIFEFKPFAVRTRELSLIETHCCKTCKELSQTFHPDDDWFCRKGHVGFNIAKTNECEDYDKRIRS
jgi:hypothetical protein